MNEAPITLDYHERTKLFSGASNASRRVEAALVPKQYKRYTGLPSIALPAPSRSDKTLFDVLTRVDAQTRLLTFADLSAVLHYAAGIVRRRIVGGRELAFRAASCTGALYHIELYVVCGGIDGLPPGVYHYDVLDRCLRPLRSGDYRRSLAGACCDQSIASADASVVLTSTFWRNAWRYEERAYRHVFWDAGTILANLLAVAAARGIRPELRPAFIDEDVNALLGVDARREAAVAVVGLGAGSVAEMAPGVTPLGLTTEPLSRAEIEYPLIWQTHAATSLTDCAEVETQRRSIAAARHASSLLPLATALTLEQAIERRGSARRFSEAPLGEDVLRLVLGSAAAQDNPAGASGLLRSLLIVNRVEGLESGAYSLDAAGVPSRLRRGDFAIEAGHLALDQSAATDAAVNLYFVASHAEVAAAMGERGYRNVQLEAGMRVGRVYLAAASLGLNATGLTFYDDEVASFFGLDPNDTLVLMLVAFGS